MYYIYVIQDTLAQIYIGYSSNLRNRLRSHLLGTTSTTSKFVVPKLIYYEAYLTEKMARIREKRLKQYGSSYTGLLKRLGVK